MDFDFDIYIHRSLVISNLFRILHYNKQLKTMANTILSLTEENKNYLLVFLGDYYNKCGNTINKASQDKLTQIIFLLAKTLK